jgi:beta-lactamase superfamily II metal-dependent hydrolase
LKKAEKAKKVKYIKRGLDYFPDLKFDWGGVRFFMPDKDYKDDKLDSAMINRKSAIIQLVFRGTKIIFTADTDLHTYKEDLKTWSGFQFKELSSKILQASHHGSRSFFKDKEEDEPYREALNAINPDSVFVSVGKDNDYDLPHKDAMDIYKEKKREVYRTDKNGTVIVTLKYEKEKVTIVINDQNTIDSDYVWKEKDNGDDSGNKGKALRTSAPAILPSHERSA